ncbi:DEAD/DEAH box helicase [Parasporobacterium paucivorans]|uniref:Superfamily II DNA and RNA helicase n=1 Tax=Parasporobacterium paucivorans DSM 15970 TaxID=1122934 RepID=A0A1M6H0M7_9FIRM|nr:DEAD/DEAH box helicase [Parasporobacterium paucivorans]SHJ15726.1 Superfamily II DNA and RNA helicase [Parasporobacterium paucivorans DSM 15970]
MDFKELGLDNAVIEGLKKEGIRIPTGVQQVVIRPIMEKKDLIAQSETGSGKTLAYLLPVYQMLLPAEKGIKILVLVPTHELALQVQRQVESLSGNSGLDIASTVVLGNVNINRQIEKLREKPQIVIGTPGRILELIKKKKIPAHLIKTVIVDEADKMLDKDNKEDVKAVIKCCMRDTQLLMFSASLGKDMLVEAALISKEPEIIRVSEKVRIPENISHICFLVERREKIELLRKIVTSIKPAKAMVFINNPADIEELTGKLKFHHYNAECIHGGKTKEERKKVIQDFRLGKLPLLIATDIAARGLHFEDVTAVFHVSIPETPSDYLHRAGRTGRNNKKGLSISVVTKSEMKRIKDIEKEYGIKITLMKMDHGKMQPDTQMEG